MISSKYDIFSAGLLLEPGTSQHLQHICSLLGHVYRPPRLIVSLGEKIIIKVMQKEADLQEEHK